MRRFGERIGAVRVETQIGSINEALRNSTWNFIGEVFLQVEDRTTGPAAATIARDVLRLPIESMSRPYRYWLLARVQEAPWYLVYELLEYVVRRHHDPVKTAESANQMLEREHSGYRFIGGQLAPVTTPAEVAEIERALSRTASTGLEGVRAHIAQALALSGKRPDPDYRNAIKEAISAVEGIVKIINGTRGGGLHAALETVAAKLELHPALKAGLERLYGYTSDEDGIRHPILEEAKVTEVDARFFIVICSAFVNFLISKAEAAGLLVAW